MSRPKPTILAELTNKSTYKTEQVLASEGVWAVYFDTLKPNVGLAGHATAESYEIPSRTARCCLSL